MLITYLDDAGNIGSKTENHYVLAGISIFERQIAYVEEALNGSGLQTFGESAIFPSMAKEDTMSIAEKVRNRVLRIPRLKPFTTAQLLKLGSRNAVDKALSRLVRDGVIQRIIPGMFARPEYSKYINDNVMPGAREVVKAIAKARGDKVQVQAAEAALSFMLSTQVPMLPIFYTTGPSRKFKLGGMPVTLKHVSPRKMQLAGTRPGLALSALWYLGKRNVDEKAVRLIRDELSAEEFKTLQRADMPAWMARALARDGEQPVRA